MCYVINASDLWTFPLNAANKTGKKRQNPNRKCSENTRLCSCRLQYHMVQEFRTDRTQKDKKNAENSKALSSIGDEDPSSQNTVFSREG